MAESTYILPTNPTSLSNTTLVWDATFSNIPIIIDNGSYNCRAGYSCFLDPCFTFKNVVVRPRGQKRALPMVGNDIHDIESMRHQLRTPFDRNLVTQFDVQEQIFDHIFSKLSIGTDKLDCPVVINEAVSNPLSCRSQMSELIFENYGASTLCYYVDAVAALLEKGNGNLDDSLLVSLGYHTTHILPVINGTLNPNGMRINVGGAYLDYYMQRLLQLRFPYLVSDLTLSRAEHLVHNLCHFSLDYVAEVVKISKTSQLIQIGESVLGVRKNFTVAVDPVTANDAVRKKKEERLKLAKERRIRLLEVTLAARNGSRADSDATLQKALRSLGLPDYLTALTRLEAVESTIERLTDDEFLYSDVCVLGGPRFSLVFTPDIRMDSDTRQDKKQQMQDWTQIVRQRGVRAQRAADRSRRITVANQIESSTELEQRRARLLERRTLRRTKRQSEAERRQRVSLLKGTLGPEAILTNDANLAEDGGDSSESEADAEELSVLEHKLFEFNKDVYSSPELGYQFRVDTEKIRVPELLYRPSMMGIEQAGLGESIEMVLSRFPRDVADRLAANVVVTGSPANLSGCVDRLQNEVRQVRPMEKEVHVSAPCEPDLAAWRGARKMTELSDFQQRCITKQKYEECGHEYLQSHSLSNQYVMPL